MEEQKQPIQKIIDELKNSKTDEEFCESLKRYTTKLSDICNELETERKNNKSLRNNNHLLAIENAKLNIDLVSLKKKIEDLEEENNVLKKLHQECETNEKKCESNIWVQTRRWVC